MLTAAQLWYICSVYPEHVTDNECREEFNIFVEREDKQHGRDQDPHWRNEESIEFLWQARANIINNLTKD